MSDKTAISWTDHTFNPWSSVVVGVVAGAAEGNAVTDLEAQFRMDGEGLDVVGAQVAAPRVSTTLAGEVVPSKHVEPPALVFGREPLTAPFGQLAVLIRRALRTAFRHGSDGCADSRSFLDGAQNALAGVGDSVGLRVAHLSARFCGMRTTFEWRYASLRVLTSSHTVAGCTLGSQCIPTALIYAKLGYWFPRQTAIASFLSRVAAFQIFDNAQASLLGC